MNPDLSALPGLFHDLPDGTTLVMQITQAGPAEVVALLGVTFGEPSATLGGTINILATRCTTAFHGRNRYCANPPQRWYSFVAGV